MKLIDKILAAIKPSGFFGKPSQTLSSGCLVIKRQPSESAVAEHQRQTQQNKS